MSSESTGEPVLRISTVAMPGMTLGGPDGDIEGIRGPAWIV